MVATSEIWYRQLDQSQRQTWDRQDSFLDLHNLRNVKDVRTKVKIGFGLKFVKDDRINCNYHNSTVFSRCFLIYGQIICFLWACDLPPNSSIRSTGKSGFGDERRCSLVIKFFFCFSTFWLVENDSRCKYWSCHRNGVFRMSTCVCVRSCLRQKGGRQVFRRRNNKIW